MSTTNQTTSSQSYQYNNNGLNTYNSLQGGIGTALQQSITNPYQNMFFNTQYGMQRQANAASFGAQQQALQQRSQALGINPNSPQYAYMLNQLQRQNMATNAQGYNSLLLNAAQLRQQSIGMAQNYRPLQMGATGTQTQSQGGLGQFAPLLGAAIGAFTGGMGGFGGGSNNNGSNLFLNPNSSMLSTQMAPNGGVDQLQAPQMSTFNLQPQ